MRDFPTPKNVKNVCEFLGLAGYYRRFIDKFSQISKPLASLLKKDTEFHWGPDQQRAFETLRAALCSESILQYPDFSKPFNITTDASGSAIGAVLSQGEIGHDRPIAYASRLLQGAELNYSTIEKECLAIIYVDSTLSFLCLRKQVHPDHGPSSVVVDELGKGPDVATPTVEAKVSRI